MRKVFLYSLIVITFFAPGCCQKKVVPGKKSGAATEVKTSGSGKTAPKGETVIEQPMDILQKTGLNYSLDSGTTKPGAKKLANNAFFETQYLEGIALMEKGEYSKAVSVFEEISKRYPNSEEASVAKLCIAELYFRNKANDLALKTYEEIVEKFPNSHAAENAMAGIKYLKDFEKYEQEYIPADVEDRQRRGY